MRKQLEDIYPLTVSLAKIRQKYIEYYYGKNLQGDVTAIYDRFGMKVVGYTYDAWGNIASTTGTAATTIGAANPFRYRSYYYDTESGMYYLNSRYYNPAICRFISPDSILGDIGDLQGYNLYAYCSNNPVNFVDYTGHSADGLLAGIGGATALTPLGLACLGVAVVTASVYVGK